MLKVIVLITSILGTVLLFLGAALDPQSVCGSMPSDTCLTLFRVCLNALLIAPFTIGLSIIGYFVSDKVFTLWARFAACWVPLSLIFIYAIPGQGISSPLFGLDQYFINSIISSLLFVCISIVLFVLKTLESRKSTHAKV